MNSPEKLPRVLRLCVDRDNEASSAATEWVECHVHRFMTRFLNPSLELHANNKLQVTS